MSQAPVDHLDESLKETEIGSWISENKNLFIIFLAVLVIGGIGSSIYKNQKVKSDEATASVVFEYKNSSLKDFQGDKLDAAKLVSSHKMMIDETSGFEGALATSLETVDALVNKGNLNEALNVINDVPAVSSVFGRYFIASRKAVILEDLGKYNEAIAVLEDLASNEVKIMEAKTYLDLGRMYIAVGSKDKAKSNFEYIVNNLTDAEFVKIARLYLSDLGK